MSREFLNCSEGRLLLYRSRRQRRVTLDITGIEPRSKRSMPESDKVALQKKVITQLKEQARGALRGPLVLSISLSTTHRTPSHAPAIVKNLLDLLGKPHPDLGVSRRAILYRDDKYVEGLSVICQHGQPFPRIAVTAVPFWAFLQDLGLARYALECTSEDRIWGSQISRCGDPDERGMELLPELRSNENTWRTRLGDKGFERAVESSQMQAQRWLLRQPPISVTELSYFYGAHGWELDFGRLPVGPSSKQEADLRANRFRITLPELPQRPGTSQDYIKQVDAQLRSFRDRFSSILAPLRVPIGLQVIVKPPPAERASGPNDLDNVLRNYLIRRTVELFKPPYKRSLYDVNEIRVTRSIEALLSDPQNPQGPTPVSARIGLTRYEAWRVPRDDGDATPGYVSMALVADQLMGVDMLGQIDSAITDLAERD